jgi:monoterpene epsilon-lactone hydrolase
MDTDRGSDVAAWHDDFFYLHDENHGQYDGPLLGPQFRWLLYVPRPVFFWLLWAVLRIRPTALSPLRGDLSGLPPTLIQVSEAEMLLDDAHRYANKANASGSIAVLQSWPHMVHVWKVFLDTLPQVPQAREAFDLAKEFIDNPPPAR